MLAQILIISKETIRCAITREYTGMIRGKFYIRVIPRTAKITMDTLFGMSLMEFDKYYGIKAIYLKTKKDKENEERKRKRDNFSQRFL